MQMKRHSYQTRRRGQSGITLVHILAYVTILAVVINLGATLFVALLRMHDAGSSALETSRMVRRIEAEVHDSVSEAVALHPRIGDYTTSEDAIVLELPPNEETGNARYAVLQRLVDEDEFVLRRLAFEETPAGLNVSYMKTYRAKFKMLELIHWGVEAWPRAVGLRFALRADENPQGPAHEYSIMAALGGIGGAP